MRVLCINNSVMNIDSEIVRYRLNISINQDTHFMDLKVGEQYDVVAIEERDKGLWLFLHTVDSKEYPYLYPVELFEFIDTSIPSGWRINFNSCEDGLMIKRISFPRWVDDDYFYEKLVDGDNEIVNAYHKNLFNKKD